VAAGGRLDWLPEPLVATARCHHTVRADVDLAADAVLTWRDELICGRTGEQPGDLIQATVVRRTGRPLSHQELRVGPSAPGWAGPAGLGGHRAVGSVLLIGLDPGFAHAPIVDGARGSLLHLAGPAVLASAIAVDAYRLRKMLTAIIGPGHDTATGGSSG